MTWYMAPALEVLRAEVDRRWPNRDRSSDGGIGDLAHSQRASDHNPDGDGSVNARDFDVDGINVDELIARAIADRRTAYVIHNRRIWQNPAVYRAGGWQSYSGSNPHTKHVHVSVRHADAYEDNRDAWGIYPPPGAAPAPATPPPAPTPWEDHDVIELIRTLYTRYLDREARPDELLSWSDAIAVAKIDPAEAHKRFRNSPAEGGTITAAYREFLGRPVDPTGKATWTGKTIGQVFDGVYNSAEAKRRRGAK